MKIEGRNILVVGFARSGLAAANFLLRRGARVTITDIKTAEALEQSISRLAGPAHLSLGGHRMEDFLAADLIILSPGVATSLPELGRASEREIPIYSEVELAYRFLKGKVVGVTGSNGKTTTTTLIGELFKNSGRECVVAGNIGSPLLHWVETLGDSDSSATTFLVELSSFQLETIEHFRCHMALLLNVTPDHQDRYEHFEDYVAAKERIFLNQTSDDFAILNADNSHTSKMGGQRRSSVLFFSRKQLLEEGVFVEEGMIRIAWKDRRLELMPVQEIRLRGNHNLENVLAAAAAGFLSGLDTETMARTFSTFAGVEHRLEPVRELQGIHFYNDSKATNVESASQALKAFAQPLLVIMGGQDKGADFETLRPLMAERAKLLILLGSARHKISADLGGVVETVAVGDMREAVQLAGQRAVAGDVVLLSPGCASFDMFDSFEHRGQVFKQAVWELGTQTAPSERGAKNSSEKKQELERKNT